MPYKIVITASAEKEIRKLPANIQDEIFEKIESLKEDPRPHKYKKLNSFKIPNLQLKPLYRVRTGDYRIVYAIQDNIITITIVKVGHRKEIYQ